MLKKKCISCEDEDAEFCVKGTSECYCEECALEHFGDLDLLVKIEDDAKALQRYVEEKVNAADEHKEIGASDDRASDEELIDVKIKAKGPKKEIKKDEVPLDDELIDVTIKSPEGQSEKADKN